MQKILLFLIGLSSILGSVVIVTAQTGGCAAQGCAQMFGVKGPSPSKYTSMQALMASPTASISRGWSAGPNRLTTLSQGGIPHYIEAGPTKDCIKGLSCSTIHPYFSYADVLGNPDEKINTNIILSDSATYYRYSVRSVGFGRWNAFWCERSNLRCSGIEVSLGQGNGFPYVGSGGESNSRFTPFGRIDSKQHTALSGISNKPWCYSFFIKNNARSATISPCGADQSWTVQYYGAASSVAQNRQRSKMIAGVTKPKSWFHASENELSKFALQLLHEQFRVLSGTPRVLLVKRLKNKELEPLGIEPSSSLDDNFPVALIILKAHVDTAGAIRGVTTFWPVQYVGYIIELESGGITTMTSHQGGRFKKALKDNSIPDDTIPPAMQKWLKEQEKLPKAKAVPLPFPLVPKRTCKICVQGL
jgi:hypothetical protein